MAAPFSKSQQHCDLNGIISISTSIWGQKPAKE